MTQSTQISTETQLSYAQFLERCSEDSWAEWLDGEVVILTPASDRHQDLSGFLAAILRLYAETRQLGAVRSAPFQMHLAEQRRGREPDLLFIAQEHLERLQPTYLEGPADLAVEIVSPESRLRDRGAKFAEYEAGGVREYWLLDPEERRADFYLLGRDGRYDRQKAPNGRYSSPVLSGMELQLEWLWQRPLPPLLQVLKALELV